MAQMRCIVESVFGGGAWNMAIDSAIAEAVAAGEQLPTLRLYGWEPFCLSLGYGQRSREADPHALKARGWNLVRRPTGGKAILHGDELTYSLCLPLDHPLAGGDVVESYRRISVGLLRALDRLGVTALAERQGDGDRRLPAGPVCFAMPSHYEISVAGRKLIGSAQLRRKGLMLHHGTIPLTGDVARICDVLAFESEAERDAQRQRVRGRAVTLAQVLGREPAWSEVAAAIDDGFSAAFDLTLDRGHASADELSRAAEIESERFGNGDWTMKR